MKTKPHFPPKWTIAACAALGLGLASPLAAADRAVGEKAMAAGDFAAAMEHLLPLAEAGDPLAQFDVGAMYDNGLGVSADPVEAARWYQRAARQGDPSAMFNLGVMYEDGIGVGRDPVQAYVYFALAVEQGPPYAQRNRDKVKAGLSADELARGEDMVRNFNPVPETDGSPR
ncbi:sel1 repeat family protein [Zavarzinia compransoris]|uniref:tetratricopeptide repeat protein n=1 Tax=Zavarzinia marina TaxID=2911065 RepID=UPI001F3E5852|nr:tetratricopeptide repeat protein [Zavarzinia marina]MCF4164246.1 sel1 repeat family protein [Zavarzinia marina]